MSYSGLDFFIDLVVLQAWQSFMPTVEEYSHTKRWHYDFAEPVVGECRACMYSDFNQEHDAAWDRVLDTLGCTLDERMAWHIDGHRPAVIQSIFGRANGGR